MCDDPVPTSLGVTAPTETLVKLLEECLVQSLAIIYYYLREGIGDPRIQELTDEVVRTTLWQTAQVCRAFRELQEETAHGQGG